MDVGSDNFARSFGDSLRSFLDSNQISYAEAARRLEMGRATLNTYFNDDKNGKRKKARVELLYLACVRLGFHFEYNGYRIGAESLSHPEVLPAPSEQLDLKFDRQFNLTQDDGRLSVSFTRRQPGRLELTVALEAAS